MRNIKTLNIQRLIQLRFINTAIIVIHHQSRTMSRTSLSKTLFQFESRAIRGHVEGNWPDRFLVYTPGHF